MSVVKRAAETMSGLVSEMRVVRAVRREGREVRSLSKGGAGGRNIETRSVREVKVISEARKDTAVREVMIKV